MNHRKSNADISLRAPIMDLKNIAIITVADADCILAIIIQACPCDLRLFLSYNYKVDNDNVTRNNIS